MTETALILTSLVCAPLTHRHIHGRQSNADSCLELWTFSRHCACIRVADFQSQHSMEVSGHLHVPAGLLPEGAPVPIEQEEALAAEMVWTVFGEGKGFFSHAGFGAQTVQPAVRSGRTPRRARKRWSCLLNSRLPPRRKREFRSSAMLRNVYLYLVTDVSGKPIDLIFKGQAI
jgi:hypothetical protein